MGELNYFSKIIGTTYILALIMSIESVLCQGLSQTLCTDYLIYSPLKPVEEVTIIIQIYR